MLPGGIGLEHFLVVSAFLFAAGASLIVMRRNSVLVLMGLELVLNAAALNFIAFSRFSKPVHESRSGALTGDAIAIFAIILAAAEAAVALAIVLNIYNNFKTIDVDEVDALRE